MSRTARGTSGGWHLFLWALFLLGWAAPLSAQDIIGDWDMTIDLNGNQAVTTLTIARNPDGTLSGKWGTFDLSNVKLEGDEFTFTCTLKVGDNEFAWNYIGTLKDGKLTGTMSSPRGDCPANAARGKPISPTVEVESILEEYGRWLGQQLQFTGPDSDFRLQVTPGVRVLVELNDRQLEELAQKIKALKLDDTQIAAIRRGLACGWLSEHRIPPNMVEQATFSGGSVASVKWSPEDQILEDLGWKVGLRNKIYQYDFTEAELTIVARGVASALKRAIVSTDNELKGAVSAYLQTRAAAVRERGSAEESVLFASLDGREDIRTSDSGLRYEIISEGADRKPGPDDMVLLVRTDAFANGIVFADTTSSADNQNKTGVMVRRLLPGIREGIQLIGPAGRIRLYVPAKLGYGDRGLPGIVPPAKARIIDVRLLEVKSQPNPKQ